MWGVVSQRNQGDYLGKQNEWVGQNRDVIRHHKKY